MPWFLLCFSGLKIVGNSHPHVFASVCRSVGFLFEASSPTSFCCRIFYHFQCREIMMVRFDGKYQWLIIERDHFHSYVSIVRNH